MEFRHLVGLKSLPLHPQLLELDGLKLLVIVTGRKPVCWRCGVTSHLPASCLEKVSGSLAPVVQDTSLTEFLISATPVMGIPASSTGVAMPPVGPSSQPRFPEMLSPVASAVMEKREGNGWWMIGLEGSIRQRSFCHLKPPGLKARRDPFPLSTLMAMPQSQN